MKSASLLKSPARFSAKVKQRTPTTRLTMNCPMKHTFSALMKRLYSAAPRQ